MAVEECRERSVVEGLVGQKRQAIRPRGVELDDVPRDRHRQERNSVGDTLLLVGRKLRGRIGMEIEAAVDSLAYALHLNPASAPTCPMLADNDREISEMVDIGERRLGVDEAEHTNRRIVGELRRHVAAAEQRLTAATVSQRS